MPSPARLAMSPQENASSVARASRGLPPGQSSATRTRRKTAPKSSPTTPPARVPRSHRARLDSVASAGGCTARIGSIGGLAVSEAADSECPGARLVVLGRGAGMAAAATGAGKVREGFTSGTGSLSSRRTTGGAPRGSAGVVGALPGSPIGTSMVNPDEAAAASALGLLVVPAAEGKAGESGGKGVLTGILPSGKGEPVGLSRPIAPDGGEGAAGGPGEGMDRGGDGSLESGTGRIEGLSLSTGMDRNGGFAVARGGGWEGISTRSVVRDTAAPGTWRGSRPGEGLPPGRIR